ncbi:hypothetical protein M3B46_07310 [Sphingobacterium daejeonense]|uniref:hypothetical protein n=1 Tax=Sphingobacterium daejeonense TaxID=371142 RepID=UPI0021A62AE1|nr:hypothetical protein [Sphingobacterium daejeonense]MCT1530796.1 hypothetical protein [Sphingobacterium daejeonense]
MKAKFLFLGVIILLIFSCQKLDINDVNNIDQLQDKIAHLEKTFKNDSTSYYLKNSPNYNFRQSLQRVIHWNQGFIDENKNYIFPVSLKIPEKSNLIFDDGTKILKHKTFFVISEIDEKISYSLWTLINSSEENTKFNGILLKEDYFSGTKNSYRYIDNKPIKNNSSNLNNDELKANYKSIDCFDTKIGTTCVLGIDNENVPPICTDIYERTCIDNTGTGAPQITETTWEYIRPSKQTNTIKTNYNKRILDSLANYPCARLLLSRVPNLNNAISQWMKDNFVNADQDILFRAATLPEDFDGTWDRNTAEFPGHVVTINTYVLENSSNEYLLATMYHEVLHAFLATEYERLANEGKSSQFSILYPMFSKIDIGNRFKFIAKHNSFGTQIEKLADALISAFPKLTKSDALALAKGGIVSNMTDLEKAINKQHRKGMSGEKCKGLE